MSFYFLFILFKKYFVYLFLERGGEGEREKHHWWEKHQCVVVSHAPPVGDLASTQACALTGHRTSDPLLRRLALNALSHISQSKRWALKVRELSPFYEYNFGQKAINIMSTLKVNMGTESSTILDFGDVLFIASWKTCGPY